MSRIATPGGSVARRHHRARSNPFRSSPRRTRALTRRFLLTLGSTLTLLACRETDLIMRAPDPEDAPSLAEATIRVVEGASQKGAVGALLPVSLVAEVLDADGAPFVGAPVEWSFAQGVGEVAELEPGSSIRASTDEAGRSSIGWRLGTTAGVQQASVRIVLPTPSTSTVEGAGPLALEARAFAGPARSIAVTPPEVELEEGDSIELAAVVSDEFDNVLEGPAIEWASDDASILEAKAGRVLALKEGSGSVVVASGGARRRIPARVWRRNRRPTAMIEAPSQDTTVTLGDAVDFQGSASDADGSIQGVDWLFGDGSSSAVEDPGAHMYATAGTYTVSFRSTDDRGARSVVDTRIVRVVETDNQAPSAAIDEPAQDVTVDLGEAVTFQGSASDADGTVASHAWDFGDGTSASVEDPGDHTYTAAGTYAVTYAVTDDDGATSMAATRTVTVQAPAANQPPTATILAPSQDTTVTLGDAVSFQGSTSDPDGTVQTRGWLFGDGGWSAYEDPGDYVYAAAGTYTVAFQSTDDQDTPSPIDTRTITVVAQGNQAPSAAIDEPSQDVTVMVGDTVAMMGSAGDADGSVVAHSWDFGDGGSAAVEDPIGHVYGSAGTYGVTYQVWDDDGAASPVAGRTVTVTAPEPPNQAPTASIVSPGQDVTVTLGDAVDFQGSASDPDGTIQTRNWLFGDGNGSSVEDPGSYVYGAAGTYTVAFQVTDDDGAQSAIAGRTVTVTAPEPPNQAPTAMITSPAQGTTVTLGEAVSFQGSASDPDGSVVTHGWAFGDGGTASVEDPGSYTYASAGTYGVSYRVWDDDGAQSSVASRTVTVVDPPPPPPPPGGGVVYSSDWSSGEYTDGGKWKGESMWVNDNSLSVANGVLRINATDDLDSWLQIRSQTGNVASPAIGETISWTWRMRVTQEGTEVADELTHGIGWGSMAVPNGFAVMYFYTRPGQWRPELYVADPGGARPYGWSRDYPSAWNKALQADVWYDFTVSFERIGTSSYRPTIEVREVDGTMIASTPDFYDWPMRGSAAATSLSNATISNGNARNAVEFVGVLNGLADHNYAVTWGEMDFVRAERH